MKDKPGNQRGGGARRPAGGPQPATRAAVARLAGVSPATVTYALSQNEKIRIGATTAERVRVIAAQLGYRPQFARRAMAAGRSFSVGLVVPAPKSLLFPFYGLMIDGLLAAMYPDDYDPLLLAEARWDRVEAVVRQGRVDGLVMIQSVPEDRWIRRAAAAGMPLVVLNRNLPAGLDTENAACVLSDHERMMRDVVGEFVSLGCRRLLNFSAPGPPYANRAVHAAFRAEMEVRAGSGIIGNTMAPVWEHFKPQVNAVFEQDGAWDGIFVDGGQVARELVGVAEAHGLAVGTDFQLIVTDAFPETEEYTKREPLARRERAVYWQQPRIVGEEAWRLMASMLRGAGCPRREVRVPYVREAIRQA